MDTAIAKSRRERPAKPALTRNGIVAAAVNVMRSEGLEQVTMRRLARELDTGPASLYVYVQNTAELHAAVLDEMLGLIGLAPSPNSGRWDDSVVELLWSYAAILFDYPGLARSALVTRPAGPNYLGLVERLLTLLRTGSVSDPSSAWGIDLLLLFATSSALEHGTRRQVVDPVDDQEALTKAIRQATPSAFPAIASLGTLLISGSPKARFDWQVRVILTGMAQTNVPGEELDMRASE